MHGHMDTAAIARPWHDQAYVHAENYCGLDERAASCFKTSSEER